MNNHPKESFKQNKKFSGNIFRVKLLLYMIEVNFIANYATSFRWSKQLS